MTTNQKREVLTLLGSLVKGQDIAATEKKLDSFSQSAGYGMLLLSIFSNENGPFDELIRHQTGILLKNFISKHWERGSIGKEEKNAIKKKILSPALFQDERANIRKTTALIVSVLAELDYPENWGNLLDVILSMVKEACNHQNVLLLSGSIDVLKYFVEHICDLQLPAVGPVLFPLLLRICSIHSLPIDIRKNALSVYHNLLAIALEIRIMSPDLTKQLINPTLLKWLQFLNDDVLSNADPSLLPLQSLSLLILNDVTKSYSVSIVECLPRILGSTWKLLLFYSEQRAEMEDEAMYSVFDNAFCWMLTILRHKRSEMSSLLDDKLNDISSLMLKLLNYGQDDLRSFLETPNEFMETEETIHYSNSLRALTRSMLLSVLEVRPRTGYCSLLQSAKRTLSSSNISLFDRESVLLVLGYLALSNQSSVTKAFVIEDFLKDVLWSDLKNAQTPLLQFRALSTLTKFVSSLKAEARKSVIPQIFQSMKSGNPLCVRYAAFKCFDAIMQCSNGRDAQGQGQDQAVGTMDKLLDGVMPMLCHLLTKMDETTIKYGLRVLSSMIKCNKAKCSEYEGQIIPLVLGLWSKHCLSEDITRYIKKVISVYASMDSCRDVVIQGVIPTVDKILATTDCDVSVTNCSLQIMHILMVNSFKKESGGQIQTVFYRQFLPKVLKLVYGATDSETMNVCAKILCLLIEHNPQWVMEGKVDGQQPMMESLCQIISKFLSPKIPEEASNGVGPLINQLVMNLKSAVNDAMLSNLLLTIIGRIDSCSTATLRNQLLLIFARLVLEYGHVPILEFLAKHGKLEGVLSLWCSNHNDFIYPYYKKLSVVALSKMLDSDHSRLAAVRFDGYPIINIHAPRASRSRSRGQPLQFTKMAFPVKFFQILLSTFRDLVPSADDEESIDTDIDEDEDHPDYVDELDYKTQTEDEDEEYDPEADGESDDDSYHPDQDSADGDHEDADDRKGDGSNSNEAENSSLLRREEGGARTLTSSTSRKMMVKDIQLELCPEARKDKIFYMDYGQWATDFTRRYSTQSQSFQMIISQLNEEDKRVLKTIVC